MLMIEPRALFQLKLNFLAKRSSSLKTQAGKEHFLILGTQLIMFAGYIDPNAVGAS